MLYEAGLLEECLVFFVMRSWMSFCSAAVQKSMWPLLQGKAGRGGQGQKGGTGTQESGR